MIPNITSLEQAKNLFPRSPAELEAAAERMMQTATRELDILLKIPPTQRTFENTVVALDHMGGAFASYAARIQALDMVSPDAALRESAKKTIVLLQNFAIEKFSTNKALYHAFKAYAEGNYLTEKARLNPAEIRAVEESMKAFKRAGLELPDAELKIFGDLQKELAALSIQFESNINSDNRTISVPRADLKGVPDSFIDALARDADGNYLLRPDYPTRDHILMRCDIEKTREAFWRLFNDRAYPANEAILKKVIELRDKIAHMVGFESFAAYDCDDTMAHDIARITAFLDDIVARSQAKVDQEIAQLKNNLPAGVTLVNGKIKPWDFGYIKDKYKTKFYDIDELAISHYFPMDSTIKALLEIYERFFDITFTQVPLSGLWHDEVRGVEVRDKQGALIGFLLLDLHPRAFKYTHACQITVVPTITTPHGEHYPGVALVIANFPQPTAAAPSLLMRNDVITFFHEFGHALHALFGSTELIAASGTSVKMDFVEMPSQMLEEWMWDAEIIKMVSSHYETHEPLDDDTIARLQSMKNYSTGDFLRGQISYGMLALSYYAPGEQKDSTALKEKIFKRLRPYSLSAGDHFEASFGHLMGYGAKYYGYLWSKVYALDLFDTIKQQGLLNPEIGRRFRNQVLAQGDSKDPLQLLKDFLGRAPRTDAFFKDLGL